MPGEKSVLLVDGADHAMQVLADRLRLLDFRVLRAKTPEHAFRLAEDSRFAIGAALVPLQLPVADVADALAALRARTYGGDLAYVAVGPPPPNAVRERLRAAGVQLALWEPFEDGRLRFQVNRALAGLREIAPRGAQRVPVELPVQIWSGGRRKMAGVYALSAAGIFLETPRPTPKGGAVALELPLAPGAIHVEGRVVYTNVPGNLRKKSLPLGMAVAFTTMPDEAEAAIQQRVAETAASLVL